MTDRGNVPGQHIDNGAAVEVEIASAHGVGVHELFAVA